jgi:uncharacterized membrane protein
MFDRGEFLQALLGPYSLTEFVTYLFFFGLGALIFFGIDVRRSFKSDPTTPKKFSFLFMLKDNVIRFLSVLASIYMVIRFYEGLYGTELTELLAMTLGVSIDALIGKGAGGGVKNLPAVRRQRDALVSKLNNGKG